MRIEEKGRGQIEILLLRVTCSKRSALIDLAENTAYPGARLQLATNPTSGSILEQMIPSARCPVSSAYKPCPRPVCLPPEPQYASRGQRHDGVENGDRPEPSGQGLPVSDAVLIVRVKPVEGPSGNRQQDCRSSHESQRPVLQSDSERARPSLKLQTNRAPGRRAMRTRVAAPKPVMSSTLSTRTSSLPSSIGV